MSQREITVSVNKGSMMVHSDSQQSNTSSQRHEANRRSSKLEQKELHGQFDPFLTNSTMQMSMAIGKGILGSPRESVKNQKEKPGIGGAEKVALKIKDIQIIPLGQIHKRQKNSSGKKVGPNAQEYQDPIIQPFHVLRQEVLLNFRPEDSLLTLDNLDNCAPTTQNNILDEDDPKTYRQIGLVHPTQKERDLSPTPCGDQDRLETEEDRGLMFTSFLDQHRRQDKTPSNHLLSSMCERHIPDKTPEIDHSMRQTLVLQAEASNPDSQRAIQMYKEEVIRLKAAVDTMEGTGDLRATIIFNEGEKFPNLSKYNHHSQKQRMNQHKKKGSLISKVSTPHDSISVTLRAPCAGGQDIDSYESERSSIFNEQLVAQNLTKKKPGAKVATPAGHSTSVNATVNQGLQKKSNLRMIEGLNKHSYNATQETMNQQESQKQVTHVQSVRIQQFLELTLRMQSLKEIDQTLIAQNQLLRVVDLRNNLIKELPESLCSLAVLWKIRVDYNLLEALPEGIGRLEKLEVLTASNNKIKSIPGSLYQRGDKMQMLLLNDNKIKRVSSQIGQLKKLRALYLHNNLLKRIPTELAQIKELQEFSLEWFTYTVPQSSKVLKDERGRLILKDFMRFIRTFQELSATTMKPRGHPSSPQLPFILFVLHFTHSPTLASLLTATPFPKSRTLLHQLFLSGHLHLLKHILTSVPMTSRSPPLPGQAAIFNVVDSDNSTPVVLACKNHQSEIVEWVMGGSRRLRGVEVDLRVASQRYGLALGQAVRNHDFKVAHLLLREMKKQNSRIKSDIRARDTEGQNCLHLIMTHYTQNPKEYAELAIRMIRLGADPNALNNQDLTPLHLAIKSFQNKGLKFALDFNLYQINKHQALGLKPAILFDLNLACGKNDSLWTPLHFAVYHSNLVAVNLLVQYAYIVYPLDPCYAGYIFARDSDSRLPQGLCPFNSPLTKIIYQCQSRLLTSACYPPLHTDSLIVTHQHLHSRVKPPATSALAKQKRSHSNQAVARKGSVMLYRQGSSALFTANADDTDNHSPYDEASAKKNRSVDRHGRIAADKYMMRGKPSMLASRYQKDAMQSVGQNQSQSKYSQDVSSFLNQDNRSQSKHSPRVISRMTPLPPKSLIRIEKQNFLGGLPQKYQMLEMDEFLKSTDPNNSFYAQHREINTNQAMRFMTNEFNFETRQDELGSNDELFLTFKKQDNQDDDIDYQQAESSDSEFSDGFDDQIYNTNKSGAQAKSRLDFQHYIASAYSSAPHSCFNSKPGSRAQSILQNQVSGETAQPVNIISENFSGAASTVNAQDMKFPPALNPPFSHLYEDRAPAQDFNDEDEDFCDAAPDEEEPEAGAMGSLITKKINKFSSEHQRGIAVGGNNAKATNAIDLEHLRKMIIEVKEAKKQNREAIHGEIINRGSEMLILDSNGYKSYQQQQTSRSNDEDDDDEGNVFDTIQNQGFSRSGMIALGELGTRSYRRNEENAFGNQQINTSMHPFSSSAVENLLKDGLQMRGKMIQLNKDCIFYSENKVAKDLETRCNALLDLYKSEDSSLSLRLSKTYSLYLSLFSPQPPINLSQHALTHFRGDHTLNTLLETQTCLPCTPEQTILAVSVISLMCASHSKTFIPFLERMLDPKHRDTFRQFHGYHLIIYETRNALDVLTQEAMVKSRAMMEAVNRRVHVERERSREKMIKRINNKDRANLSDDSINNENAMSAGMQSIAKISMIQNQRHQQSVSNFSIREVPEFVARLQKSPSVSSLQRSSFQFQNSSSFKGTEYQQSTRLPSSRIEVNKKESSISSLLPPKSSLTLHCDAKKPFSSIHIGNSSVIYDQKQHQHTHNTPKSQIHSQRQQQHPTQSVTGGQLYQVFQQLNHISRQTQSGAALKTQPATIVNHQIPNMSKQFSLRIEQPKRSRSPQFEKQRSLDRRPSPTFGFVPHPSAAATGTPSYRHPHSRSPPPLASKGDRHQNSIEQQQLMDSYASSSFRFPIVIASIRDNIRNKRDQAQVQYQGHIMAAPGTVHLGEKSSQGTRGVMGSSRRAKK